MTQDITGYPSLGNLEGETVEELFELRCKLRTVRDQNSISIDEEISASQSAVRRDGISERRIYEIRLNELKMQLDEVKTCQKAGSPAMRVKVAELREKISELGFQYGIKNAEREHKLEKLAIERLSRKSKNQLAYEEAEIEVCKAIRAKNGFSQLGYRQ